MLRMEKDMVGMFFWRVGMGAKRVTSEGCEFEFGIRAAQMFI